MRFDRSVKSILIYENPDVCSLLMHRTQTELDKIHGREAFGTLSGTKYMDRIYTTKQSIDIIFENGD
jgi:hypothetical protein